MTTSPSSPAPSQYAPSARGNGGPRRHDGRLSDRAWLWRPSTRPARYDAAIAAYLEPGVRVATVREADLLPASPDCLASSVKHVAVRREPAPARGLLRRARAQGPNSGTASVLHGKELSYNNLLDLDSALRLIRMFAEPAACILKHNNPCGAAVAERPRRGVRAGLRG